MFNSALKMFVCCQAISFSFSYFFFGLLWLRCLPFCCCRIPTVRLWVHAGIPITSSSPAAAAAWQQRSRISTFSFFLPRTTQIPEGSGTEKFITESLSRTAVAIFPGVRLGGMGLVRLPFTFYNRWAAIQLNLLFVTGTIYPSIVPVASLRGLSRVSLWSLRPSCHCCEKIAKNKLNRETKYPKSKHLFKSSQVSGLRTRS